MANLNDLDLKICATEGDAPATVEKDTLVLVKGDITIPTASSTVKGGVKIGSGLEMDGDTLNVSGGESTTPQIESVPSVLQPNISYWEEPTADKTFTFAAPTEGIVNHYHVLWISEGAYTPTFTTVPGDGLSHGWSVLCGEPPSPLPSGWYEFSFLYADTVLLGMWAKVSDV